MSDQQNTPENEPPMNLSDLSDAERTLIVSLRSEDRDTATEAFRTLIWDWLAPMWEPSEPSINNPYYDNPNAPTPADQPAPRRKIGKLRLWLMKHGLEFEWSDDVAGLDGFQHHACVAINHLFFGVDVMIAPFKGVFEDELNFPHAEIAAQYTGDLESSEHGC